MEGGSHQNAIDGEHAAQINDTTDRDTDVSTWSRRLSSMFAGRTTAKSSMWSPHLSSMGSGHLDSNGCPRWSEEIQGTDIGRVFNELHSATSSTSSGKGAKEQTGSGAGNTMSRVKRLWVVFRPFCFGFLGCLLVLVMPINDHNKIDFWQCMLLRQGIWGVYSVLTFEMVYHAALPLLPLHVRLMLQAGTVIVWIELCLVAVATEVETGRWFYRFGPTFLFWPIFAFYAYAAFAADRAWMARRQDEHRDLAVPTASVAGLENGQEGLLAPRTESQLPDVFDMAYGRAASSKRNLEPGLAKMLRRPATQFCYCTLFLFTMMGSYYCLDEFKNGFKPNKTAAEAGAYDNVYWYLGFLVMNVLFRCIVLFLGLKLDAGKQGEASLYFYGEIMTIMYYFTFYRSLFVSFFTQGDAHTWIVFFVLQILHCAGDWLLYPFRTSVFFRQSVMPLLPSWWQAICTTEVERNATWRRFATLRSCLFGIRVVVTLFSLLAVYSLVAISYKLNQHGGTDRPYVNHLITAANLGTVGYFFVAMAAVETMNFIAAEMLFYKPNNLDIFWLLPSVMRAGDRKQTEFIIMTSLIISNLLLNVAITDIKFNAHHVTNVHRKGTERYLWVVGVGILILSGVTFLTYYRWVHDAPTEGPNHPLTPRVEGGHGNQEEKTTTTPASVGAAGTAADIQMTSKPMSKPPHADSGPSTAAATTKTERTRTATTTTIIDTYA